MTDDRGADGEHGSGEGGGHAPDREEFGHDPVGHVEVSAGMSVAELVEQYGRAGIGAAELHEAVEVYAEMLGDPSVTNFFGLAGAMVPAGMRRIVADLIRAGHVDALVTTGANLTHDAIEAVGGKHHHGRDLQPGKTMREHDEQLRDEAVDRIYNVYLPQEHFTLFEEHLRAEVFPAVEERAAEGDGTVSIAAFARELGRANAEVNEREGIEEDPGIAAAAYEHDVPVHVPAIQDSVLGLQAWLRSQVAPFALDALGDMSPLNDLAYDAERAGAVVVGGGVPKNYVLQTMLVTPGAYDYA
ncbi:deoxyhypusine synthase, partial [Halobacteriales archaeon QS_5_70_15]